MECTKFGGGVLPDFAFDDIAAVLWKRIAGEMPIRAINCCQEWRNKWPALQCICYDSLKRRLGIALFAGWLPAEQMSQCATPIAY